MTPIEYIDGALALVADRLARYPGYEVLLSAEKQLQYIRSVLLDRSLDRSALHQLTLGSIAVKEFDETDPELSRALKDAYYVGIRTGRGLKVDLP
ncbi:immunity protein Tsi6 family protein [Pseudomonas aeruginosa]|uniref:immunity protein Tsi6 family protein n=1 Tax=Pseudomonas aeruginosa TaxID=287 RepID=UPI003EE328C4